MPQMKNILKAMCLALALLAGCQGNVSRERVLGTYEGTNANARELVELAPSGHFKHEVYLNGKSVLVETGLYSAQRDGTVTVEPFTSYFDRTEGMFRNKGERFDTYYLYFLEASGFDILKEWPERDYFLRKRELPKAH